MKRDSQIHPLPRIKYGAGSKPPSKEEGVMMRANLVPPPSRGRLGGGWGLNQQGGNILINEFNY